MRANHSLRVCIVRAPVGCVRANIVRSLWLSHSRQFYLIVPQYCVKVKQLCRAGTKWGGKQAESTNRVMLRGNVTRNNRRYEAKLLM